MFIAATDTPDITDDSATQIRHALQQSGLGSSPPLTRDLRRRSESDYQHRHDGDGAPGWSATQIAGAITGIPYPAQRWEIVAWAQYNGASPMMIEALLNIAEDHYPGPHRIARAVHAAEAAWCCRHRRHPRHCSRHTSRWSTPVLDTPA